MKADRNIAYVGTLQEMGCPLSMLFVDKEKRQLYIFVSLSDCCGNSFLVAKVSPDEVESYMNESVGLLNILNDKTYSLATIHDDEISFDEEGLSAFTPTERMKRMNMFDPELCYDDVWLEVFLNRIINNQPLEIA